MHFDLVDRVLEQSPERLVSLKAVSAGEEYLRDHFPTFPVLPGVLMIEAMVQSARRMIEARGNGSRHVLGSVKALKYGTFVRPGDAMRIEVSLVKVWEGGVFEFKGSAVVIRPDEAPGGERPTCVSGRFTLRPVRV